MSDTNAEANDVELDPGDEGETPTLADILLGLKAATKYEMRVAMPGLVVNYNKDKQVIDARPVFQSVHKTGTIEDPPTIHNIPVIFPRSGKAFLAFPLQAGDGVILFFTDRSLEKWQTSGNIHNPEDTRAHHISDAIAIPGGYPSGGSVAIQNGNDVILSNDFAKAGTEIRVKPNGHLQIFNQKEELVKVLNDMLQIIMEARTPTCGGPEPLTHPKFDEIRARIKTFQEF